MRVDVRLFAAAREAVGSAERTVELPSGATLADVLAALEVGVDVEPGGSHPEARAVLDRCSILVDGEAQPDRGARVPDGATVDVLPPFAGG